MEMTIEDDEIFDKPKEEVVEKKPRKLTDKQKQALQEGRAKAKAIRDAKKKELKEASEDAKVASEIKSTGKKIKKKQLVRQEAIEKRVRRNAYERKFDDIVERIASDFDDENELKKFNRYLSHIKHDDFHSEADLKKALLKVISIAGSEHRPKEE